MERQGNAKKVNTNISYIPLDVLFCILWMLPIKSVMKLKCVCKAWCLLIDEFRGVYLNRIKESSLDIIVFKEIRVSKDLLKGYIRSLSTSGVVQTLMTLSFQLTEGELDKHLYLMQSINGLICVTNQHQIKVCNPLTGEVVTLPEDCPNITLYTWNWKSHCIGFGYNALKDEYKVVKIFQYVIPKRYRMVVYGCAVCTLSSGSDQSWKKIKGPDHPIPNQDSCIYLDGSIYWTAEDFNCEDYYILISFDLENETFKSTRLPFLLLDDEEISLVSLAVMENTVCVVTRMEVEPTDIDIWRMDDDGNWVKNCLIPIAEFRQNWDSPFPHYDIYVNCLDKHKILVNVLLNGSNDGWILYDLESKVSLSIHDDYVMTWFFRLTSFSWGNMLPIGAPTVGK